jgi:hypothetical protein
MNFNLAEIEGHLANPPKPSPLNKHRRNDRLTTFDFIDR